jgi:hypothetical protein
VQLSPRRCRATQAQLERASDRREAIVAVGLAGEAARGGQSGGCGTADDRERSNDTGTTALIYQVLIRSNERKCIIYHERRRAKVGSKGVSDLESRAVRAAFTDREVLQRMTSQLFDSLISTAIGEKNNKYNA